MQRTVAHALVLVATAGCFSTDHRGRDPRKVYVAMEDGRRGYTKHGEFHSEMGFGGSLLELVADDPEAARAARTYRSRSIAGALMTIGGSVCLPAVMIYGLDRSLEEDGNGFTQNTFTLMLGCALLSTIGVFYWTSGMPYQLDAVNIYNDGVDARPQWPPPAAPQLPALHEGPPGS
ncbi:MAG: hypothetical protein WKG01_25700 [Kofleriaceae bacterium]